ncbi:uncharacterized protein ACA1_096300 [Acanthamoeba castellanii str. Neff]|uniref:Cellulose binding domain containing protein n=1 Tax=Acanthamoeba castellanii (strain ATCC 30010 / Neff) TaxID=1257118 RepID=L8GJD8_ACACF|nr:uncharacterized protein ACA1_096300 [Acanthamoeba castellanii str. Neff]ELR12959.1 hypothetical protein ACA1_096300 [Acanthamoeba castellanii str. Neff]
MMRQLPTLLACFAALFCLAAAQTCQLSVPQLTRPGGSWTEGDFRFQIYDLPIVNEGSRPVTAAVVSINLASSQDQMITQFWNLQRQSSTSNLWNVVNPGGNIEVGSTLNSGFVVRSPISAGPQVAPVTTLVSVSCDPIVSTPRPSVPPGTGCSAVVASIVPRSAAAGGNWSSGPNQFFQIFDILITNNGERPVNGGVITFGLPVAGSSISQSWELNRQGNSNVFNVAFNYGPLQVGASQGAGIVVQTSSPSQAVPSAQLSNITCA